ncbi:hypothetical protein LLG46_13460 [bacterium]|nr:hypothetical protein [bacterium]
MKRLLILITTCLILLASPCFATTCYVTADGAGSGDWSSPYSSIQAAIDAATSGDEVWVRGYSDGVTVYPENLTLKSGVSIRGGYTGNGSERSESYVTTVFPSRGTVISASNIPASPTTLVEYLTIKTASSNKAYAGGINCESASPTFQHCHICYCLGSGVGGICADIYSSPTIEDCEIDHNSTIDALCVVALYSGICRRNEIHDNSDYASMMGAIYVGPYGSGVTISDNHIYSNSAISAGGGIYIDSTSVTLTGNIIENNSAYYGNGLYWNKGANSGSMYNNVIKGNSAGASAIYINTTACTGFVNNTIVGNTGDGNFKPVEITGGTLDLYNNIIANNSNYGVYTSGQIDYSYYNCLYNNGTNFNVTPSYSAGVVTSSPTFDTDGYHITSDSNCLNAGYSSAPGLPTTDLDGDTRILYSAVDIGADEYVDELPPSPGTASSPTFSNGATAIQVDYTGASDDASGLKEVVLWYREGVHGAWTDSGFTQTGASGSFSFSPTKQTTYYFDLVAEDNAGNMSSAAAGDGDCQTICQTDLSSNASGHAFIHNEYLYPGGPKVRVSAYDDQGSEYRQTTITYGSEGEVVSQSGSAESAGYTYDAAYRVKTISDGNNQTTSYTYDLNGNITLVELPGGDTIQYTEYDPIGNVLERIDPNSVTTNYVYDDPESLLTDIEYPDSSSLNVHYDYDSVYGRLTSAQDGTGTTTFDYDDLDLVTSATTTYTNLPARTIEYDFWPDGSLDTMTTPAGDFTYTYDAAGRPTGLTNPFSESFSWDYYSNDWLQTQTSPVSESSYEYNPRGFLTSLTNSKTDQTLLSEFTGTSGMVYDAVGNLQSVSVNIPGSTVLSGTTDYTYDIKNQLTQELSTRNSGYTYNFVYDDAGNPTTFKGSSRTFNSRNQNTAFTYDANGNPTSYNSNTLVYDPENRLTQYGSAMNAGYTADGLRAWKQSGTTVTYSLYAGGVPVCEMDDTGSVMAINTFGPTGLLARRDGSTSTFYTYDPLGSAVQTLDSSGTATSTQLYDAYGNLLAGIATTPFGYGAQYGYYTDSETGLQLLSHRYYDPAEGRFLTRDPIGYEGGMNLYGYVENNPVNAIDPSGLCGETSLGKEFLKQLNPFDPNSAFSRQAYSIGDFYRGRWKSAADNSGWAQMQESNASSGEFKAYVGTQVVAGVAIISAIALNAAGTAASSEVSELELQTHHIVEQRNIGRFGKELIDNPDNLVDIEKSLHQQISNFYSSKKPFLTGSDTLTVRQWMNTMNYEQQLEWGKTIIQNIATGRW